MLKRRYNGDLRQKMLFVSLFIVCFFYFFDSSSPMINNSNISLNYESDELYAVLEIPKIKLKKNLFNTHSNKNSVDYGIEILAGSIEKANDNLILASHSGNSKISFFKKLHKLHNDDIVNIYYQNKQYIYKVVNNYKILKNGKAKIYRDKSKNSLTLITCDKSDKTKQIVYICELYKVLSI